MSLVANTTVCRYQLISFRTSLMTAVCWLSKLLRVAFWSSGTIIIYWVQACARIGGQASAESLDFQWSALPWWHLSFGAEAGSGKIAATVAALCNESLSSGTLPEQLSRWRSCILYWNQAKPTLPCQPTIVVYPSPASFPSYIGKNCLQPNLSIYDRKWSFFGVPVRFQESTVLLWSSGSDNRWLAFSTTC